MLAGDGSGRGRVSRLRQTIPSSDVSVRQGIGPFTDFRAELVRTGSRGDRSASPISASGDETKAREAAHQPRALRTVSMLMNIRVGRDGSDRNPIPA